MDPSAKERDPARKRRPLTPEEVAATLRSLPERADLDPTTVHVAGCVCVSWCGTAGTVRVETDGHRVRVVRHPHGAAASCTIWVGPGVPGGDLVATVRREVERMCPRRTKEGGTL
jgi:hypothetical protein